MFAHRIVGFTGPEDMQWAEVAESAADGGVVIDVAAAGVADGGAAVLRLLAGGHQRPGGPSSVGKINRPCSATTGCWASLREFFEQQPATVADVWGRLLRLRRDRARPDPPVQLYPFSHALGALRAIARRLVTGKVVLSRQT